LGEKIYFVLLKAVTTKTETTIHHFLCFDSHEKSIRLGNHPFENSARQRKAPPFKNKNTPQQFYTILLLNGEKSYLAVLREFSTEQLFTANDGQRVFYALLISLAHLV